MPTNSATKEQHLCPSSDPSNSVGTAIRFHSAISGKAPATKLDYYNVVPSGLPMSMSMSIVDLYSA